MKMIESVGESVGHAIKSTINTIDHETRLIERMITDPKFRDKEFKKKKRSLRKDAHLFKNEIRLEASMISLLKKHASGKSLTKDEEAKVHRALKDICKAVPALGIFLLPGGIILLPMVSKILPFDIIPSEFKSKKKRRSRKKRRNTYRRKNKTKKRASKQKGGAQPEPGPGPGPGPGPEPGPATEPEPETPIPTAHAVKDTLGKWKEPHCVPYEAGSVMILESSDTQSDDTPFIQVPKNQMMNGVIYQYIMYKINESSDPELLLVPAYQSPEIGTKHRCLIERERIKDNFLILGSGEITKNDNGSYTYSCMSSLFNYFILPLLRPMKDGENPLTYSTNLEEWKETYEKITMKRFMETIFGGSTVTYAERVEGSKQEFNPETLCQISPKPSCIRYVTNADCATQLEHPDIGLPNHEIDCRAGEDFCDLLSKVESGELNESGNPFDSPETYKIPESKYIKKRVVNVAEAKELLQSKGIPSFRFDTIEGTLQRGIRKNKITLDEYDRVFEEKIIWPKNV